MVSALTGRFSHALRMPERIFWRSYGSRLPVPLHDEGELLLDPLVGGEPPRAGEAFPPAPDDVAVLARPGIDHLVVHVAAPGAFHAEGSVSFRSSIPTSSSISRVKVSLYPSR